MSPKKHRSQRPDTRAHQKKSAVPVKGNKWRSRLQRWKNVNWKQLLVHVLIALASGSMVALAFPDFGIWPLAWVAWVPLTLLLERVPLKRGFWLSFLAGGVTNVVGFSWIYNLLHEFGHLPAWLSAIVLCLGGLYQGLSIALALLAAEALRRNRGWSRLWTLPLFYTTFEVFHLLLFPWYIGNCQYPWLDLIQIADLVGVPGVTFVVILGNAAILEVLSARLQRRPKWPLRPIIVAPVVLAMVLGYGALRVSQIEEQMESAETFKVGVVEPEIGIYEDEVLNYPEDTPASWILRHANLKLQQATSAILEDHPDVDLVVWPETCYFPVISVYARDGYPRWLLLGDEGSVALDHRLKREYFDVPKLVKVASAGGPMIFGIDDEERLLSFSEGKWNPVELPEGMTPVSVAVLCSELEETVDSRFDGCTALVGTREGKLAIGLPGRFDTFEVGVAVEQFVTFPEGRFVGVGGSDMVVGNLPTGELVNRAIAKREWVDSTSFEDIGCFLTKDGILAWVEPDGSTVVEKRTEFKNTQVNDIAALPPGGLVLATDSGLLVLEDGEVTPLHEGAFAAVDCNAEGQCMAQSPTEQLYFIDMNSKGQGTGFVAMDGTPESLSGRPVALPLTRYFWWLPAMPEEIYTSSTPLPDTTTYPEVLEEDFGTPLKEYNAVQRDFNTPLLFGATSGALIDPEDPASLKNTRYNSAFLVEADGTVLSRYDKQFLLAFGEYLPGGEAFPILYEWIPEAGRSAKGPNLDVLNFHGTRLGVLICYEDIIAPYTNKVAEQGVDLFINVTNDAWFGKTQEPKQHFVLSLFRSIEHRRSLIRSTTTGISGFVDPTGRIAHMTDLYDAETFVSTAPILTGTTVYESVGHHFPKLLLVLTLLSLMVGFSLVQRIRRKIGWVSRGR